LRPLLLIIGFILGLPFFIPFSNYIYVGIIFFNLRFFSWWVIALLAIWAYVTVTGSDGAREILNEESYKNGLTTNLGINTIVFHLLRMPFPIAAIYAIKKAL
tara:strand:+ start:246 stop:551 length:306 start_codon:yes stop_codon:yes gene_type:complete